MKKENKLIIEIIKDMTVKLNITCGMKNSIPQFGLQRSCWWVINWQHEQWDNETCAYVVFHDIKYFKYIQYLVNILKP